ncbi:MAG: reductive dehalogenase [Chloroflexi bacterium]|uniref:reductive dehalogenase n=1 Tax=Candidatus Flexifilum breve TaxID=3140694 RepID=UPI00313517CE|nr:reductive dehalogenase [Chloroflexota bacterium]
MTSSLNRREFLKEMGLLGMGAATVAALGPIEEFGESWSDKPGMLARPNWVRTIGQPTAEIDWEAIYRFDERNTVRRGWSKYMDAEAFQAVQDQNAIAVYERNRAGQVGYSTRDIALYRASGIGATQSFLGPDNVAKPEENGIPRWEGTPEEASEMIRSALRAFGAATVGFVELDANTEKLIYAIDPDGKELVISEDTEVPEETETQRIIPKSARWVITWTVQMSQEAMLRSPTPVGAATTALTYAENRAIQSRLQGFLRGIGYYGLGESETNALGIAPAFGVLAGLGEMSRLNRMITPEYGPMVRAFKMVTNLPVAPTSPIDAGIMNFCRTCKTCATYCPSGALNTNSEPSYETQGAWSRGGVRTWYENSLSCRNYWAEVGTNCGICFAVCPFSVKDRALIHSMVKGVIGTTTIFNSALAELSRTVYSPGPKDQPQKDPEEWWRLDYAEFGIDSRQGHADA